MHYITSVRCCSILNTVTLCQLTYISQGYIDLGLDIGLLVFDEAHHAIGKHPYNMIMKNHYHHLPPRTHATTARVRPMVLGLTASPSYGSDVEAAFQLVVFLHHLHH